MNRRRVVAVVGSTATGKSDLAVVLAQRLGGEIVNVDVNQMYRGMDVGSGKPSEAERGGVPHHLFDLWDVTVRATAGEVQHRAREQIDAILDRDRTPIVVGGCGLYPQAVLDRFEFPDTDASLRAELEDILREIGPAAMHRRLGKADPHAAALIPRTDGRRIVRALEVVALTGRPFAASLPTFEYMRDTVQIGLTGDRNALDRRIALRHRRMWDSGLLTEVRRLAALGLRRGATAARVCGYRQALAVLDGRLDERRAYTQTVDSARRISRRQLAWGRRDPRIHWLAYDRADLVDTALSLLTADAGTPLRGRT
ncbi:tRNA (adenosine(37)-N6)-dimethylallyltransferase MiaA [Embleya sp. NPDC001921]